MKKKILIITDTAKYIKNYKNAEYIIITKRPGVFDKNEKIIIMDIAPEDYSKQVWDAIDSVNSVLDESIIDKEWWIFEPHYHIEGYGIAQSILDFFLIYSFAHQIHQYNPKKIVLHFERSNAVECSIIREYAIKVGICVECYYHGLAGMRYHSNKIVHFWGLRTMELVRLLSFFRSLLTRDRNHAKVVCDYVVLMVGSINKRYSWHKDQLLRLKEEISVGCVTMNDRKSLTCIDDGIEVYDITNCVTPRVWYFILKKYLIYRKIYYKYCRRKISFKIENTDFSNLLRDRLDIYFSWDMPAMLSQVTNIGSFFSEADIKVVNAFGNSNFYQTRAVKHYSDVVIQKSFDWPIVGLRPSYEKYDEVIDIRDTKDSIIQDYNILKLGGISNYISKIKMSLCDGYTIDKIANEKINILYAPCNTILGLNSYVSRMHNIEYIFTRIPKERFDIKVKFHPGEDENNIRYIKHKYKDCQIIDKDRSIIDAIAWADIIVTDASLVIFDSIVNFKPVIVVRDGFLKGFYQLDKENPPSVDKIEEIGDLLDRIYENYNSWANDVIRQQNKILDIEDLSVYVNNKIVKQCKKNDIYV